VPAVYHYVTVMDRDAMKPLRILPGLWSRR